MVAKSNFSSCYFAFLTVLCLALKKRQYKIFQSRKTMVRHKLSPSGRDSGAFSHFRDSKDFWSDLLRAKMLLLFKHSPWKLFVLPLLDLLTLFEIFIASKRYNLRIIRFKMISKKRKISDYFSIALLISYYYFYGLMLLLRLIKR